MFSEVLILAIAYERIWEVLQMRAVQEEGAGKTVEDYLEAILMIRERQGYVRSIDVAEQLGVTKPSVTYSTKRLKEAGYITNDHAGMLVLTEKGQAVADKTYKKHTTLSQMFEYLGVSHEQAVKDACLIEHDISDETFNALCQHARKVIQEDKNKKKK